MKMKVSIAEAMAISQSAGTRLKALWKKYWTVTPAGLPVCSDKAAWVAELERVDNPIIHFRPEMELPEPEQYAVVIR